MGDVIDLFDGTRGDIPVDVVLDAAKTLQMVCVMGITEDGREYFASSSGDYKENYWLAARFKQMLMEMADGEE
jgi:hypothetical protein